jgi:predicted TIM-barrel fold metal-dependent hydrolase
LTEFYDTTVPRLGARDEYASPHLEAVLRGFPTLPVIIEHLGGISRDEAPPYPTFHKILALAQYHNNTYITVHGLREICHRPMPFPEPMRFL